MFYSDRNIFATSQSGVFLWRMILEKSRVYCKTQTRQILLTLYYEKPGHLTWDCKPNSLNSNMQSRSLTKSPKSKVESIGFAQSKVWSRVGAQSTFYNMQFFMKAHFREKRQHMLTLWRKADAFRWDIYHFNVLHSIVCWWENYFLCQMGYT